MRKMDDVLGETVDLLGLADDLKRALAVSEWSRAAGPRLAVKTAAYMISRAGTLFVYTASPAWAQELTAMKRQLIDKVNSTIGADVVKDIRFQGKGVERAHGGQGGPGGQEVSGVEPVAAELDAKEADPEDVKRIAEALAPLPPGKMREQVERALERNAKLLRWRLSNGWSVCRGCGTALPPGEGQQCPDCRVRSAPNGPDCDIMTGKQ